MWMGEHGPSLSPIASVKKLHLRIGDASDWRSCARVSFQFFGVRHVCRWLRPAGGHAIENSFCFGIRRGCLFEGNGSGVEGGPGPAHGLSGLALRPPFGRLEARFSELKVRQPL